MGDRGGGLLAGLAGALRGGDGPAKAGFRRGAPVGLYLMTRYWYATGSLETAAWYFAPDGRLIVDPEEGFSEAALAAHTGDRGTFEVTGGELIIRWFNGETSRNEIERDEDGQGFAFDTGLYQPVVPFGDAAELVGRWEGGHRSAFSGSSGVTSRTLELRADGTFTWDSAAFVTSSGAESDVAAGSSGTTTGSWRLAGHQLRLVEDGSGRTFEGVAFPWDDEETAVTPDRFYFRGTMYRQL